MNYFANVICDNQDHIMVMNGGPKYCVQSVYSVIVKSAIYFDPFNLFCCISSIFRKYLYSVNARGSVSRLLSRLLKQLLYFSEDLFRNSKFGEFFSHHFADRTDRDMGFFGRGRQQDFISRILRRISKDLLLTEI